MMKTVYKNNTRIIEFLEAYSDPNEFIKELTQVYNYYTDMEYYASQDQKDDDP